MTDREPIERLVTDIRAHPSADFYRAAWGGVTSFDALPVVSRDAFAACPLSQRSYKIEQGLVRVIHGPTGPYLSAWGYTDIAREPYGLPSKRPLIHFTDAHETVEKSMWSYFNHMVPLAGEKNNAVTELSARAFDIDSLITDPLMLANLLPYVQARTEPLASISLISHAFDPEDLMRYRTFANRIRLVLALPETGAFAQAELTEHVRFTLLGNCRIEDRETIVLTKVAPLITPIIRFDTGIPVTVIA